MKYMKIVLKILHFHYCSFFTFIIVIIITIVIISIIICMTLISLHNRILNFMEF